jgi:hypothetical protein
MNESFINDTKYPTYPKYPKGIPSKKGPPIELPMGFVPGSTLRSLESWEGFRRLSQVFCGKPWHRQLPFGDSKHGIG